MAGPIPAQNVGATSGGSVRAGAPAKLILFGAKSYNELMCRPQADRVVLDRGRPITTPLPAYEELSD